LLILGLFILQFLLIFWGSSPVGMPSYDFFLKYTIQPKWGLRILNIQSSITI
jgi:hypothetical protein